ncbi:4'-phosphopantetheinyl transferase family protein (plasmid) [Streptomyces sp. HUAS TT11]|uniref:4'-phosphopantetheinyl transferase family protein n=1 Tax=Streptomyces sp. HUAS TT11 TaxID=3447508 RepID=UPI003F65774A
MPEHTGIQADSVIIHGGEAGPETDGADLAVLSVEERDRHERFRVPHRAAAYAAAHAVLRHCVGGLSGEQAKHVQFGRQRCVTCGDGAHGRPIVEWPPGGWEFSLSRSGPFWMVAVARGVRVGIDIEQIRPVAVDALMDSVLHDGERDHVAAAEPGERLREFMRCWTRKEAVVKASGIGITAGLREIDVAPGNPRPVVQHRAEGCSVVNWQLGDLTVPDGCIAALAVPVTSGVAPAAAMRAVPGRTTAPALGPW